MASFDDFLNGSGTEDTSFGNRMANIFAEDDADGTITKTKMDEKPKISNNLFTTTAFLSVHDAQSIKCGLLVVKNEDKVHTIMYDASKKCIFRCELNQLSIESITQENLTIAYNVPIENSHQKAKLTFIDTSDFTRYAVLLFLHNTSKSFYVLDAGSGEPIDENYSVLYDTVKYSMEDSELCLPVIQANIKAKLTPEKISAHQFLPSFLGLSKNANLLVKPDENTVVQIHIRKIKSPSKTQESSAEPEDTPLLEKIAKIGVMLPSTSEVKSSAPEEVEAQEVAATEKKNDNDSLNLYEIVHRVVGVEIDRMEMRLNARFDKFEKELMERLEKQARLLESLTENAKKLDNL